MASFILKSFIIIVLIGLLIGIGLTLAHGYVGSAIVLGVLAAFLLKENRAIFGSNF